MFTFFSFQEMVSIESFIELVKKRDIGRIKFAIRETNFNIDSKDEVSGICSPFMGDTEKLKTNCH